MSDRNDVPKFENPHDMMRWLFDSAPDISTGLERSKRMFELLELINSTIGTPVDLSEYRADLQRLSDRYALFHRLFTPRGWAMSDTVQADGGYIIVAAALDKQIITAEQGDVWLAERLHAHEGVERLLNFMSMAPLRAIWTWLPAAGEAAMAMRQRHVALSAFSWLVIAEGLWKDLQPVVGRDRPPHFFSIRTEAVPLSEGLTWTRESLVAARKVLIETTEDTFVEPAENAPTNRHSLLHGNVSGFLQLYHGVKAFTLVEAIVNEAKKVISEIEPKWIEPPPWR